MIRHMDELSLQATGCRLQFTGHRSPVAGHIAPRPAGFTLLELIIVMALCALILGLSSVFVASTMPSARLSALARELSATTLLARTQADMRGEAQTLTINLDARQYSLQGRPTRLMPPDVTVKVTDPFTGDVEHGTYTLRFEPFGPAPAATILLRNPTRQMIVELDPIVGAVLTRQ